LALRVIQVWTLYYNVFLPLVLWHHWLGIRKSIWLA